MNIKKIILFSLSIFFICISVIFMIKNSYFSESKINNLNTNENDENSIKKTDDINLNDYRANINTSNNSDDIDNYDITNNNIEFTDDGSIIYDGLTLTELTDKLNRSLSSNLSNTGYYFANYTKKTGLNPYLAVAIVLLETGCSYGCSTFTVQCNNIGGLKGHGSCLGTDYSNYDSLEEGVNSYLNIIYYNYYLNGLDTPEKMNVYYAESSEWANKVNNYIEKIKAA